MGIPVGVLQTTLRSSLGGLIPSSSRNYSEGACRYCYSLLCRPQSPTKELASGLVVVELAADDLDLWQRDYDNLIGNPPGRKKKSSAALKIHSLAKDCIMLGMFITKGEGVYFGTGRGLL